MKNLVVLALFTLGSICGFAQSKPTTSSGATIAFTNGYWFDGHSFKRRTGYAVVGVLSFRRPRQVDSTVDLAGGYVVPPFGEAHNHNVEPLNKPDQLVQRYLQHGIFYVKDPDNLPQSRDQVISKINRPDSIDVMFSNGGFTGIGGHPAEIVKRNIDRGFWTEADGDGAFYYAISTEAELAGKWPEFLATKPDFVKTYLLFSEEYADRKDDLKYFGWKGMDPALLRLVVQKAHASGLRVSTHVESATDFHNAVMAGVDEINHTPGFRVTGDVKPHALTAFQLAESDVRLAAHRGIYVVTTLAGSPEFNDDGTLKAGLNERDGLNQRNLVLLKGYHVKLALGSDSYRSDTVPEALYIAALHVFSNSELLRNWCTTTAKTIFPKRRLGELKEGFEASFVVLRDNPVEHFSAVRQISIAVKQGHLLQLSGSIAGPQAGPVPR